MKETFYFTHDYNPRTDPKIKRLIQKHGYLGYGLFWAIIEDLYNNANALQTDYESIAFDLRTQCDIIQSIIEDFGLFEFDGKTFFSNSINRRLTERNEKSEKAKKSAEARWNRQKNANASENHAFASNSDANAMQTECEGNAIKEKKEKESKVKEIKEEASKSIASNKEGKAEIFLPKNFDTLTPVDDSSQFVKEETQNPHPPVPPAPPPQYGDGELQKQCREFAKKNPSLYSNDMYVHFLLHWTATVQKGRDKGSELWRTEKAFQLSSRLITWHSNDKKYGKPSKHTSTTGRDIIEQPATDNSSTELGTDGILYRISEAGVRTIAG